MASHAFADGWGYNIPKLTEEGRSYLWSHTVSLAEAVEQFKEATILECSGVLAPWGGSPIDCEVWRPIYSLRLETPILLDRLFFGVGGIRYSYFVSEVEGECMERAIVATLRESERIIRLPIRATTKAHWPKQMIHDSLTLPRAKISPEPKPPSPQWLLRHPCQAALFDLKARRWMRAAIEARSRFEAGDTSDSVRQAAKAACGLIARRPVGADRKLTTFRGNAD